MENLTPVPKTIINFFRRFGKMIFFFCIVQRLTSITLIALLPWKLESILSIDILKFFFDFKQKENYFAIVIIRSNCVQKFFVLERKHQRIFHFHFQFTLLFKEIFHSIQFIVTKWTWMKIKWYMLKWHSVIYLVISCT